MAILDWFRRPTIAEISLPVPFEELKKRVKVIVIDDEADSFPVKDLSDNGYTIEWWPRLDAGKLHRLETGAYDIIVLDIQGIAGPELSDTGDGLGVLKRIKDVNPNQVVVAFSGKAYDLSSMPFYRLADDTMAKPVSTITCKEVLDNLIRARVSVPQYWSAVEQLLKREAVPEHKIRRLEAVVVKKANGSGSFTTEGLTRIVGHVKSASTVITLVQQIYKLWRTIHS